jgi:hypothetical protein
MNFDLSRSEFENLLAGFLVGALGVELKARVSSLNELPAACRPRIESAEAKGLAWSAWTTDQGLMAAWGEYDIAASRKLNAHVLRVGWWVQSTQTHHALWCYCYSGRPTEWVVGRGPD